MSGGPPRILIVDDEFDMRKILTDCLQHQGYETFTACNGQEALALATAHPLDLALIDVWMPPPAGMALAAQLQALQPHVKVIIITAHGSIEQATEALRGGAFHYLEKPLRMRRLVETVKEALATGQAEGQGQVDEPAPVPTRQGANAPAQGGNGNPSLTPRQLQVLQLIGQGMTNREIAAELGLSVKTVGNYVSAILRALQVCNRTAAAMRARELGML
jgi:DNA-binding NarL/FixJ family response regulator